MELLSFPILFSFLLLLPILMKKAKRSKRPKLPPGPWKLPLLGNIHHMLGLSHHSLRNLAKKHGPLMHLQLGEISSIVITSPNMAKEVLKTQDLNFFDRPILLAGDIMTYGCKDLVFAPYGDYWRQLRKICTVELLSAKRVQSFQTLREEEVSNLIQSISLMSGSIINLSERIFSSTNDITSRAVFGKKCKDKQAFISVLREGGELNGGFEVSDLFPSLKFLHFISGMRHKFEKLHRKTDKILEDIIQDHKENWKTDKTTKDGHEDDLVDVLLRLQVDTNLQFPLASDNIKAIILDIFSAGSETSSTTMEWAMSEMLRNAQVMEKAQAEVRRVFKGKTKIKETDIHVLTYLKLVIKETLRLHPPVPLLLPRECRERCQIDGYEIPKNTRVIINAWAIGRDPEHWNDPEQFDPERFDGSSIDYKGNNFEFIPFGAGRRICPGISFGVANIELALAQLLYHFDWKLPSGINPVKLDMTETFGLSVRRKNDLLSIPTRYSLVPVE